MSCPVHYKLATLSVLTVTPPCDFDFDFAGCFPPSNSPSFRLHIIILRYSVLIYYEVPTLHVLQAVSTLQIQAATLRHHRSR